MHELPTAHLHFDPPYAGLIGGTILQGWLVPKPGIHFTDVRVVVGEESFPGIYGIPRRDLAEFFKADRPYLLAGFSVTLTVPPGRHRFRLEASTINGTWESLDAIERDVSAAEARPDPEARCPLDPPAYREVLQVLLRRMSDRQLTPATGAAAVIRETPARHHLQHPPRPFHGHLDQPQVWSHAVFGRVPITGWVYHESQPIKRLLATTDLQAWQEVRYGRETPFLAERQNTPAHAARAGYDGFLDLPAQLPLPASVRVYAELEDGTLHLGSVARFNATDQEFAKQSLPVLSAPAFWRGWRALRHAIRARGWPASAGPIDWQAAYSAWRDYSRLIPHRKAPRPASAGMVGSANGAGLVCLITHNLGLEGAPLFLLEYARYLRAQTGVRLAVVSEREGPLRKEFEGLGASVRVIDTTDLLRARDAEALRRSLREIGRLQPLEGADLVVANTLSSFWGVHLAHQAGQPVLFYIHESSPPRFFFRGLLPPAAVGVVEESFRLAGRVSFLTASTRRYFADFSDGTNYRINPGWIDLAALDAFRNSSDRAELRRALGLDAGRKLVINVGTVCERKGQHLFARAVDLLWRTKPDLAATAEFWMIGGRDTPYDRDLAGFLTELGRGNLRIVPETGGINRYYGAADLFVCSSYEESFPRVVLEAMAFALPIVSTGVHGIPEIVRPDREARLVPPGDSAAMAAAIAGLLADPDAGRRLGTQARLRVAAEFDSRLVMAAHLATARELVSLPRRAAAVGAGPAG